MMKNAEKAKSYDECLVSVPEVIYPVNTGNSGENKIPDLAFIF